MQLDGHRAKDGCEAAVVGQEVEAAGGDGGHVDMPIHANATALIGFNQLVLRKVDQIGADGAASSVFPELTGLQTFWVGLRQFFQQLALQSSVQNRLHFASSFVCLPPWLLRPQSTLRQLRLALFLPCPFAVLRWGSL